MIHMSEKLKKETRMTERKTGTWQECKVYDIEDTTLTELQSARCSVCGLYHTTPYLYYFNWYKYCPSCGARLYREGEENGTD